MNSTVSGYLVKACILLVLVAAGVCAMMFLPSSQQTERSRRHIIPRYQFEKEIRGPTYHVVTRIFENDGYVSAIKAKAPAGQKISHGRFQLRNRRAIQGQDAETSQRTSLRKILKLVPAHPQPFKTT